MSLYSYRIKHIIITIVFVLCYSHNILETSPFYRYIKPLLDPKPYLNDRDSFPDHCVVMKSVVACTSSASAYDWYEHFVNNCQLWKAMGIEEKGDKGDKNGEKNGGKDGGMGSKRVLEQVGVIIFVFFMLFFVVFLCFTFILLFYVLLLFYFISFNFHSILFIYFICFIYSSSFLSFCLFISFY